MLNPSTAVDAQGIVAAYLRLVEAHAAAEVYPGSLRDLPHARETIRVAFRTSMTTLVATGQLTPALREYLEIAYVSLADYIEEEWAVLLREYLQAGKELADDARPTREKAATPSWQRVTEQSRLAGQIAQAISADADQLRAEFRAWHTAAEHEATGA
jgi:hypothetical protein